jgi:hypothetical protein
VSGQPLIAAALPPEEINLFQRRSRIKLYNILTTTSLLCGCEAKEYDGTKENRDEIHETYGRIGFITS